MLSAKSCFMGAAAAIALAGSGFALAQSGPDLVVGHASQPVQTPLLAPAGINIYVPTSGDASGLSVYTKGFMLCGNVGSAQFYPVDLLINHEDQTLTPAHPWAFLPALDMTTFSYSAGQLIANPGATLTCLATANDGAVASGLTDGIFDNGLDSATLENYPHLVNWIPPVTFSWLDPDWSQVPLDPCNPTANQTPEVVEDVACAAVTGVRGPVGNAPTERAGTIWTASDGINYTAMFRVDARIGAQPPGRAPGMQVPPAGADSVEGAGTLNVRLIEAFDSAFLGGAGQYCFLSILPNTLNSAICGTSGTPTAGLPFEYTLSVPPPPVGSGASSFYVVIIRPIIGAHASATTPTMAIAALSDPAVVAEGGDRFSGDNVLFGFIPGTDTLTAGFPWMTGGQ